MEAKIEDFKVGDKVTLEIIGLGIGSATIVESGGELCIYEPSQGYYSLSEALQRKDFVLTLITPKGENK